MELSEIFSIALHDVIPTLLLSLDLGIELGEQLLDLVIFRDFLLIRSAKIYHDDAGEEEPESNYCYREGESLVKLHVAFVIAC